MVQRSTVQLGGLSHLLQNYGSEFIASDRVLLASDRVLLASDKGPRALGGPIGF